MTPAPGSRHALPSAAPTPPGARGRLAVFALAAASLLCGSLAGGCSAPAAGAAAPRVERGIVYGRNGSAALELDAYLPASDRRVPAVVLVHGGGWVEGRRTEYDQVGRAFARAGMAAFSVDYTLCTALRFGWPLEARQVLAAVGFIRRHAASLHVDTSHVGIMGDSSGATLALEAAVLVGDDRRTGLQAAAGWSGPYDLPAFRPSPTLLGGTGAWLQTDLAWFTGCVPLDSARCLAVQSEASPARHVRPDMGPVLLATSDRYTKGCEIVDPVQTATMATALRAEGMVPQVDVLHLCAHAMGYRHAEIGRTIAFFAARLGAASAGGQPTGTAATSRGRAPSAGTDGRSS